MVKCQNKQHRQHNITKIRKKNTKHQTIKHTSTAEQIREEPSDRFKFTNPSHNVTV